MYHQGPISAIAAFGPYVATAGYDNQVILWDASQRQAIARGLHDHLVNHCAFSTDGSLIVSASSDYSARIWEVPSLRLKASLIGHSDDVDMAVFSPDDKLVATCALDRTIRVFDLTGRCLKILHGHTGNIISIAWTQHGNRLVSSSVDGTIRKWDAHTGAEICCNDIDGVRTDTLVIDADGKIFAGDDKGRIVIISGGSLSYVQAHQAGIKKIAYDETTRVLVTLSYDRSIAIWQITDSHDVHEVSRTTIPALVWARSAALIGPTRIAVGTFGSTYGVFDWRANKWDFGDIVPAIGLNAVTVVDGAWYAIGDAGILLHNGRSAATLGSLCNFLLAADGRLLSGGQLGQLFDARSGEVLYQHHSPLNCGTTFRRAGMTYVAIGTYTGEALVFAVDDSGELNLAVTLKIYDNAVKGLVASEDRLFSVCASTAVAWHDISNFTLLRLIDHAHERIANGCCLAGPNGFASIGRDLKLRIWIGEEEEVYQTPHPNSVKCICASDDRNTLMTGAYTGTLAGFDMRTRTWCSFSRPTAAGISSLTFDSHDRNFLASSYDGQIYVAAGETPHVRQGSFALREFFKASTPAVSSKSSTRLASATLS